jgi:hypothetical protein
LLGISLSPNRRLNHQIELELKLELESTTNSTDAASRTYLVNRLGMGDKFLGVVCRRGVKLFQTMKF